MTAAIIIGLTLLLVAGVTLLLLGLRGRRINDHPICRGCGFDLVGVLPARTICPECGGDVANGRRVRDGARRRLHGTAITGAAITLAALAPLGFVAWGWAFAVDLNPFKPTPLLVWESGHAGPTSIDPILSELNTRWTAGSLSPAQKTALISRALDAQADTARPWSEGWGDLFDLAVVEDLPTEAERIRFESHSAIPALRVAPECQPGERLHFYIPASEYRQSATGRAHLKVHVLDSLLGQAQLERLPSTISGGRRPAILGVVSMPSEGSRARARIGGGGWDSSRERASEILEIPEDTPPGLHEISMTVAVRAFRSSIKPEVAELVTANQQLVTLRTTIKVLEKDEHPEGTVPIDRTTRVALEKLLKGSAWTQQATENEGDSQNVWVVDVSPGVYPRELAKPDLPLIYGEIYYVPDRDDEDRPVPRLDLPDEPRFLGTFHTLSTNGPDGPSRRFTSEMTGSSGPLPDLVTIIIRLTPQRARELPVPKPGFSGEVIVYGVRIRKEDDR